MTEVVGEIFDSETQKQARILCSSEGHPPGQLCFRCASIYAALANAKVDGALQERERLKDKANETAKRQLRDGDISEAEHSLLVAFCLDVLWGLEPPQQDEPNA